MRRRVTVEAQVGDGEYDGRTVAVLPLRVFAGSHAEACERAEEVLDALEEVLDRFEWAERLTNPRDCLEACAGTAQVYELVVEREAAEGARNQ